MVEPELRLKAFEDMLRSLQSQYEDTVAKMEEQKSRGREKSATYRQLMGNKLQLQTMLAVYRAYDLIE